MKQISLILFFLQSLFIAYGQSDWNYIGPGKLKEQVKGMIKSVWCEQSDLNFVLAGSAAGGLFKSENALSEEPQWECITDSYTLQSFGVSDIVVISNTNKKEVFISTSSRSALAEAYGNGILHTINGGDTWEHVGPGDKNDILFPMDGLIRNKENEREMLAFAQHLVYFTTDAWDSFKTIDIGLNKENKDVSICDVEFAPFENGKFYICTRTNNSQTAKVYQYELKGEVVKDMTPSEFPSERMEVATIHNSKYKGKFYLAGGAASCYVMYFNGTRFSPALNKEGLYQTFANAYWNFELAVNQNDTNVLYLSMTETSKSIDGGKSFYKLSQYNGENTHADNRAQLLVKQTIKGTDDLLMVGNDGGVSVYEEEKKNWKNLNGSGLNVNQFWGISVGQSDSLLLVGGTSDNGGFILTNNKTVNTVGACGDGYMTQVIDDEGAVLECNTPSIFYYDLKRNSLNGLHISDQRYDSKRPLCRNDSFVYVGYSDCWRISIIDLKKGNLTFDNFSQLPVVYNANGGIKNASVKSMCVGKLNEAVMAYRDPNWGDIENKGKLYYCPDLQKKKWIDITNDAVGNNFAICQWSEISSVQMDDEVKGKFYLVSKDIFHQTNSRLFSMQFIPDSGKWIVKEIGSGLPKIGINDICVDPFSRMIYVASDNGIYASDLHEDSLQWRKLNGKRGDMPSVPVFDIDINYATNTLYAGTFGRGVWSSKLLQNNKNKKFIGRNTTFRDSYKLDGKLILGLKKQCTFNDKLIITSGSVIELKKGSKLYLKNKNKIRDENNRIVDINQFIKKSASSQVIFKE